MSIPSIKIVIKCPPRFVVSTQIQKSKFWEYDFCLLWFSYDIHIQFILIAVNEILKSNYNIMTHGRKIDANNGRKVFKLTIRFYDYIIFYNLVINYCTCDYKVWKYTHSINNH